MLPKEPRLAVDSACHHVYNSFKSAVVTTALNSHNKLPKTFRMFTSPKTSGIPRPASQTDPADLAESLVV